jgi:hypothetical protein
MLNKAKAFYAKLGKPRLCNPLKRKVNIAYTSVWLHGTYMFTFKAGEVNVYDRFIEHFMSNLRDDLTAKEYADIRSNPCIIIKEIF